MNRIPRILFIAPLPPPVHGSSMVSWQILSSHKINSFFELDAVNLSTSRRVEEIGKCGVLLFFKKVIRFLYSFCRVFSLLSIRKYDLCYCAITCRGSGFLKDAPFVLCCKLFGKKIVIHQHNRGMSRYVNKPFYRTLFKLVYAGTKVILLSELLYEDVSEIVDRSDVFICPNGVKVDGIRAVRAETVGSPHILFLSNLLPDKGVLVLLDALKLLKDAGFPFVCDLVGAPSESIDTERLSEEIAVRGITDYAKYHGARYGKDKDLIFKHADIFVLPSFDECFPLVILESMSYAVPVIATNVGGIPDVVKDGITGIVVNPKDSGKLYSALRELITDKEKREKFGKAGRDAFYQYYTLNAFENRICDILDSCIC